MTKQTSPSRAGIASLSAPRPTYNYSSIPSALGMRTRPSSPAKMNRLKNKLRGKRDVASQDGTAPGTVAQLTDGLSAST